MGYPTPTTRNTTDLVVSVVVLVITVIIGGTATVMGVFSLAFLDYCPPATCHVDAAVTSVLMTIAVAALAGLAGLILTVMRLAMRKTAWPFAVGTLTLCVIVLFFGTIAYTAAVS